MRCAASYALIPSGSRCRLAGNPFSNWRSSLKSPRFILSLALLSLVALIAGCGGGGSSSDAKDTVKKAFSKPIKSADVNLQFPAKVTGVAQLPQRAQRNLSGPSQSTGKGNPPTLN